MIYLIIGCMEKAKYKEAKKFIFTTEKEKISKLKLIGFKADKSAGSLANEGLDYVLKKYEDFLE